MHVVTCTAKDVFESKCYHSQFILNCSNGPVSPAADFRSTHLAQAANLTHSLSEPPQGITHCDRLDHW